MVKICQNFRVNYWIYSFVYEFYDLVIILQIFRKYEIWRGILSFNAMIRNTKGKSTKKDAAYLFCNVNYSEDKRDKWLQCFMREIWLYRECIDYVCKF